jgi:hypothetical protein
MNRKRPNGLLKNAGRSRKNLFVSGRDFTQAVGSVPAPDFSPGERVFKPAETLYQAMTGL